MRNNEVVIKFDCIVVDWELTNENIEARREELNRFGIVVVHARHEDITRVEVVANCDIPEALHEATAIIEEYRNENPNYEIIVEYTKSCEIYGTGCNDPAQHWETLGSILAAFLGLEGAHNPYEYDLWTGTLCRYNDNVWTTDAGGYVDEKECMTVEEFEKILATFKK